MVSLENPLEPGAWTSKTSGTDPSADFVASQRGRDGGHLLGVTLAYVGTARASLSAGMVSMMSRSAPAAEPGIDLFGKGGAGFVEAGFAEGLKAHAERADGAGDPGFSSLLFPEVLDGLAGKTDAGGVDFRDLAGHPWRARRKRLAPKVLVSTISAPACKYSSWIDRSGPDHRFSSSYSG